MTVRELDVWVGARPRCSAYEQSAARCCIRSPISVISPRAPPHSNISCILRSRTNTATAVCPNGRRSGGAGAGGSPVGRGNSSRVEVRRSRACTGAWSPQKTAMASRTRTVACRRARATGSVAVIGPSRSGRSRDTRRAGRGRCDRTSRSLTSVTSLAERLDCDLVTADSKLVDGPTLGGADNPPATDGVGSVRALRNRRS